MPRGGPRLEWIQIKKLPKVEDTGGGFDASGDATLIVDAWASIRAVRGSENLDAGAVAAISVERVEIPYEGVEILPEYVLVNEGGVIYEITRVAQKDRRTLQLDIVRKVGAGS